MQSAEAVLSVLRDRGKRGLPCDELYRQMFNPQLYLLAYGRIYANKGSMTPGSTAETVDGMSLDKIRDIVDVMRHERYRFTPVRRVYIPKKNGKMRPLGLPTWSDKLVGEVVRLLLEAYYEPTFSDRSHGFRPGRGCHTALREVVAGWTGTTWFIEADLRDCFGSFDHQIMINILAEKIHDNRFLRLVRNMLAAGYLEDWEYGQTLSGVPQGGTTSPVLSNIYLHKLDVFVETVLIPQYTRGARRKRNRAYHHVFNAQVRARQRGDRVGARRLGQQLRTIPSQDPDDPGFRRLRYTRYADDHLLGFIGPKAEAEQIRQRLGKFLHDELKLELSPDKTLITHARTRAARFLGYNIITQHANSATASGRRTANGVIGLRVPTEVIKANVAPYLASGHPAHQNRLINHDDYTIVATYGSAYRGLVQYYLLASNVHRLDTVRWAMETSMLKTLAAKHHSTVSKMAARHRAKITTPYGPRICFEAQVHRDGRQPLVARFGGIPLRHRKDAVLADRVSGRLTYPHKELLTRFLAGRCELCQQPGHTQAHHVRTLADLAQDGPDHLGWKQRMTSMRRKSLVVCDACHDLIHSGKPTANAA